MSTLDNLDGDNARALADLRDPSSESHAILVELVTASCLLELSKLAGRRPDLASFTSGALEIISQFTPIDRATLHIEVADLPPTRQSVGATDDVDHADLVAAAVDGRGQVGDYVCSPLRVDREPAGYLAVAGVPGPLQQTGLVGHIAELLADAVGHMVEAERVRRLLAQGRALEIVSGIDDTYGEPLLTSFVEALASLPNATGARLEMANARFGGPLRVEWGDVTLGEERTRRELAVDRHARVTVELGWSVATPDPEERRLDEILSAFCAATGRVEQNLRLLEEVELDELTGVGNRRRGLRALSATRSWAERRGSHLSVLLMDLDHFKQVNDSLGHGEGDEVMTAFARAMAASLREYDTLVRWGGDEFLVVCPDTDLAGATALAERLRAETPTACAPVLPTGWEQTVSVGLAVYPFDGVTPTALVKAADDRLYAAKRARTDQAAPRRSGADAPALTT